MKMLPANRCGYRAVATLLLLLATSHADSAYSTYFFSNLFVFDTQDVEGTRRLNVVSLSDDSTLKIVGQIIMPGSSSYISAYSNYKDKLIVLLRDRLEIYDLSHPAAPVMLRSFELKNQGSQSPGYPLIQAVAVDRIIVANTENTTELYTTGDVPTWTVTPIAITPEIKSKMTQRPAMADFDVQAQLTFMVKESALFRFELYWKESKRPGLVIHSKFLRKVEKSGKRVVALLPLGSVQETID